MNLSFKLVPAKKLWISTKIGHLLHHKIDGSQKIDEHEILYLRMKFRS